MNRQATTMRNVQLITMHGYSSGDPSHLAFPAGAVLLARPGQEGNPLWFGSYGGKAGWFPISYCRLQRLQLPTSPTTSPTAGRSHRRAKSCNQMDFMLMEEGSPSVNSRRVKSLAFLDSPEAMQAIQGSLLETTEESTSNMDDSFHRSDEQGSVSPLLFSKSVLQSVLPDNGSPPPLVQQQHHQQQVPQDEAPSRIDATIRQDSAGGSSGNSKGSSRRHRWFGGKSPKQETSKSETKQQQPLKHRNMFRKSSKSSADSGAPVESIYIVAEQRPLQQAARTVSFRDDSEEELPNEEPEDPIEVWAAIYRQRQQQQAS